MKATTEKKELFTAGEWKVDNLTSVRLNEYIRIDQVLELDKCISLRDYERFDKEGEAEANLSLIAESKNMYYALKMILWDMENGEAEAQKQGKPRFSEREGKIKEILNRINNK